MPDISAAAKAFGERPDISARSVVVTVFGDCVRPAGGVIWLADLIGLARPFGFSERLLRTSITRLTHEGWFATERVGRQSRYRLTPFGETEFGSAESRIYHRRVDEWSGEWTLVFTGLIEDREAAALVDKHLGWHGFRPISTGVMAVPGSEGLVVDEVIDLLGLDSVVTAQAAFDDLAALVRSSAFIDRSGLPEIARAYAAFVERYQPFASSLPADPETAFLLRTMVVHDLRRTRLADPDLPADLLPDTWAGRDAFELAGSICRATASASARWLREQADLIVDPALVGARFDID